MNRTNEFRQILSDCTNLSAPSDPRVKPGKYSTLLVKKPRSLKTEWINFDVSLRRLVKTISQMRVFLIQNRKDYINIYTPLISKTSRMKDSERDQIDYDVHVFMKDCNELLKKYRTQLSDTVGCQQTKDHYLIVLDMIEVYLKSVCNIYTEQKAIRVKRACEKQRLSRLAATFSSTHSFNLTRTNLVKSEHGTPLPTVSNPTDGRVNSDLYFTPTNRSEGDDGTPLPTIPSRTNGRVNSDLYSEVDRSAVQEEPVTFTPEEIQMYNKENNQLYDAMNAISDEVRTIGGKVVEIARLQEIFTEKVLEQEQDLNRLSSTVIASTENIKEGNDELREAMKKSAGFRVWVLFFIITLAFTVLFLDWYNP